MIVSYNSWKPLRKLEYRGKTSIACSLPHTLISETIKTWANKAMVFFLSRESLPKVPKSELDGLQSPQTWKENHLSREWQGDLKVVVKATLALYQQCFRLIASMSPYTAALVHHIINNTNKDWKYWGSCSWSGEQHCVPKDTSADYLNILTDQVFPSNLSSSMTPTRIHWAHVPSPDLRTIDNLSALLETWQQHQCKNWCEIKAFSLNSVNRCGYYGILFHHEHKILHVKSAVKLFLACESFNWCNQPCHV